MTSEQPCSGVSERRTLSDYFERGLIRKSTPPLEIRGDNVLGNLGLTVRFSLEITDGRIRRASFQSSTCVTLVALCELLSDAVEGRTLVEAIRISPEELISQLQEVPAHKIDRAVLGVRALQLAIKYAVLGGNPNEPAPAARRYP